MINVKHKIDVNPLNTLPISCPSGRNRTKVPSRTCSSSDTPSCAQMVLATVGMYGEMSMESK